MRVMPLNLVGIFFVDEGLDWVGLRMGGARFFFLTITLLIICRIGDKIITLFVQ